MGTSQSSGGPGSGVPMVPSWVPDPPAGEPMSPEDPAFKKPQKNRMDLKL
jgi:hypothetical protein